ncbi:molybdopterin dinucleotide binding domain-containing protein [Shewanella intestini]|uniref:Molybdopterin-dependent oxidoreductase n=1 Tax=Shewanella intestini TaxID=2017544 RepID=A0ABS5I2N1_9GAMM|nr:MULTISPECIES: molybdopterin dinucleotide binding domain-containing protein [Shewanella]MBR9728151.1 molybdopterin-dependent oxidoreductase [Shewanella intestini]MRG36622.1 molybdopterin-dependent oxidoreductase [Shewanella sp. XMDDZSB0408]
MAAMIDKHKRNILKLGAVSSLLPMVGCTANKNITESKNTKNTKNITGKSLTPEFSIKDGKLITNPDVITGFARCWGCFDNCSIRVRIDKNSGNVQRVSGNPYCPNNTYQPAALSTPVEDVYKKLADENSNLRATTCGRGTAGGDAVNSKQRITSVLKRVGKRGSQQWQRISYEQAVNEIINGGNLFGEGHVDGLAAINSDKLANPKDPLFGPASKQLLFSYNSEVQIRTNLLRRFASQYRASLGKKSAYCGAQQRIGIQRVFKSGVFAGAAHAHPDIDFEAGADGCEFGIYLGTTPSNSGNSLNTLGAQLAKARTEYGYQYIVVDPILRNAANFGTAAQWQPILPGRDTPFLFGLMHHIFENDLYNKKHLENTNEKSAKKDGELHHTNASYLIIQTGKNAGKILRNKQGIALVLSDGKLSASDAVEHGDLFVDQKVAFDGETYDVVSSLALLRQEVYRTDMAEYARRTGISEERIRDIATQFTNHGRKAAIMLSTASSSADGTITGWATAILNMLIGSHNAKGGACYWHGAVSGLKGVYDLATVEGGYGKADLGVSINREGKYELSAEYKRRKATGSPYPSTDPWPETAPVENTAEMLVSHVHQRPYSLKAFISWRANVLYGASGLPDEVFDAFADPHGKNGIPLVIGIVDQISTTALYSDYLIPDLVHLEEPAIDRHWGSERKSVSASGHLLVPKTDKANDGEHITMEKFLIDVAKKLKLKGFGDKAIKKSDGSYVDLHSEAQWASYCLANCASNIGEKLPKASARDLELTATKYSMRNIYSNITPSEAKLVERLLSRGGYYDESPRYNGEFQAGKPGLCLNIYNEGLNTSIDCFSGNKRAGIPTYAPNAFWNGETWEQHWKKSEFPVLMSSYKPTFRSPWSVSYHRTVEFSPTNYIYMHQKTGKELGLANNDIVNVISANKKPAQGQLKLVEDIVPGAISIAMGFGHIAYGANDITIDNTVIKGDTRRGAGIAYNPIVPCDPTRNGASPLVDIHTYATCRHGIPVKVVKA